MPLSLFVSIVWLGDSTRAAQQPEPVRGDTPVAIAQRTTGTIDISTGASLASVGYNPSNSEVPFMHDDQDERPSQPATPQFVTDRVLAPMLGVSVGFLQRDRREAQRRRKQAAAFWSRCFSVA